MNNTVNLTALAGIGAGVRLAEITTEMDAIHKAFPDLKAGTIPGFSNGVEHRSRRVKPKRRRGMSKSARQAVSTRMKKYWANERKNAKKNFKTKAAKR